MTDRWTSRIVDVGVKMSNLRYTDDTVVMANTSDELPTIYGLEMESNYVGLETYISKSKR